jgi:hypothetical protein
MRNETTLNYIKKIIFIIFVLLFAMQPIESHAESISLSSIAFDDHRGMWAFVNGRPVYCVQRGYPFRSRVSDLQMTVGSFDSGLSTSEGKLVELLDRLFTLSGAGSSMQYTFFRGWGQWTMNEDLTDAAQVGTDGAPSSLAWQEAFDEDMIDDEDDNYNNRYQGSGGVRKFLQEAKPLLTGHEGAVEPYDTVMKQITYSEAGFSMPQVYALAITNYYCWEDPDAAGYSEMTKYQTKQALDWGIEFGFITTMGGTGDALRIIYKDSTGVYGISGSGSYSGSSDGYIKTTIGGQYEAMKLYRQVVWKTTNMRMIPSFSGRIPGEAEPIKLYWDEEQHLYTATVSDHNAVLDYFDFNVSGCSVTNNGDGTLTISTPNQIGTVTGAPATSGLEPEDGVFHLPDFYRWELEGEEVTFNFTAMRALSSDYTPHMIWEEDGNGRRQVSEQVFAHSHDYGIPCNWFCATPKETITHCTEIKNSCNHEPNAGWEDDYDEDGNVTGGHNTRHEHGEECHTHTIECTHETDCPYWMKSSGMGHAETYVDSMPLPTCNVIWCCGKQHFEIVPMEISGSYIDWQDLSGMYARGQKLIDPEICYIKVETVPHDFPAQTDTEILLIADHDEWNDLTYTMPNGQTVKHSSHLRVGEKFHLKYVYSYKGASKGFRIEFSLENKPYYQYNYLSRMQAPENAMPIYGLRTGLSGDRFSMDSISVPHAKLVQDLTDITIRGLYTTPETAYTLNGTYTWDSGSDWNDQIYLDALTEDQFDDWYNNKAADDYPGANGGERITTNNGSPLLTGFTVSKPSHNEMLVVWEFDTEPEVFSSALVLGTAYIQVGEDTNHTKSYYDEAYNYAKDGQGATAYTNWFYNFEEHNNVGGVGYFSSEYSDPNGGQTNNPIPSHAVYTQNNECLTYAVKNKVWQSDVDIKVSNFVQNTGAGITEHIYQERGRDNHDMNYNLYYTIEVANPKAAIFENKVRAYDGRSEDNSDTRNYDTASDRYEFDVNTLISWGSTGDSQTGASYGNAIVVDHIKTGTTYIQREIPTVLAAMTTTPKEIMAMKVYPNHDRLVYEDCYSGASVSGSATDRKVNVSMKDSYYPSNEQTAFSDIFAAMNPNNAAMQPQNINNSNNVPDQHNQDDNALHHIAPTTSFNIKLSNGEIRTVVDSHTKTYTQYDFEYNPSNRNNKVTFPSRRKSTMFFKYSKTDYGYNGQNVQSAAGEFVNGNKTQAESYYISQVLFKSNYTTKYMKELEAQGAEYIKDKDALGNLTDAWIDMVNQNKFAIVSAGQGFELRVTVKYENSFLTQYLARYFGQDDGQNDMLGTSNRVQKQYNDVPANSRQYANISALTGKDGRNAPYYKASERAYISSYNILDRLAVNLVTGSNAFYDLYVFMSDNPDTVYSYSGIYGTPVIFERDVKYSDDFSITTVTYTMCVSHENGISSRLQKMKFYTNQLAPDKKSPGIVEGAYDVAAKGEHSITVWTPIVAATPFDYPNAMEERYIGDAIELGYTIKTTGADDSIVHIVQ